MKKKRKNRGITLIALIITIIVLLILAGVTMSFVVGDNGVLTQAQKAKIRTDKESAEEEVKLEVAGSYDDEGNLDFKLLNENLIANLPGIELKVKKSTAGEGEEEYEYLELGKVLEDNKKIEIGSLPATVRYKGVNVKINEKQLISDLASDPDNYGMYVDYPIKLSGNEDTINDWRIFYEDKTGRVFLIAADYVPNTCNLLQKEGGSDDELIAGMKKSTDSTYQNWCYNWSSIPTYDCYDGHNKTLNQGKSQCSFPEIFMPEVNECHGHYYCSDHNGVTNSKCASQLQCTGEWSGFVDSKYAEYAIGGPTIEMWLGSWNSHSDTSKYEKLEYYGSDSSGNGYEYGNTSNNSSYHQINGDGKKDTLYFPHPDSSSNLDLFNDKKNGSSEKDTEKASCYGYWLASPSASSSNIVMCVSCSGTLNFASYNGTGSACRPVVSLKSGVYVKVEEETQEDGKSIEVCRLVK